MSIQTHKALILEAKQGKLLVGNRCTPSPQSGQLLVKVFATSLNPLDWKIHKHGRIIEEFPAVLGSAIAGEVEEVGEGVTTFVKGERVQIPANVSFEEAATIPVALTAAYVGLYNDKPFGAGLASPLVGEANRGKYSGKPLVVLGGGSSVGEYGIQLAKLSGFSPIIVTASSKHTEHLHYLGATAVIDRNESFSNIIAKVKSLTSKPIDIVYDAVSTPDTQQMAHDLLAPSGTFLTVGELGITKADDRNHVRVIGVLQFPKNTVLLRGLYTHVTQALEEGSLKPNRFEVLPGGLEAIIDGLDRMEKNQVSGVKLVALPWGA
ncbi:hypothetical protein H0H81_002481 [Sphagnurus paluster]|uniref:Enoyl reductase (ER) domain-containing protein n=1 Tax=Sphagnurus paluster TaxID=117069 RepID=A0A9P7FX54_9AGAR|nr:hypothetical protein H0H81_002481 [Sphagnurus paluster]